MISNECSPWQLRLQVRFDWYTANWDWATEVQPFISPKLSVTLLFAHQLVPYVLVQEWIGAATDEDDMSKLLHWKNESPGCALHAIPMRVIAVEDRASCKREVPS